MPGTRVVLPAIRVTRGSTHQTYAKEKLKYIADPAMEKALDQKDSDME